MKKARNICDIVGFVSLLIYIISAFIGINVYLLAIRVILAGVAATAFGIRLGIELTSSEKFGYSVFLISVCFFDLLISTMQLIKYYLVLGLL